MSISRFSPGAASLIAVAACTSLPRLETAWHVRSGAEIAALHTQLAIARQQSRSYLSGDALPVGDDVRALVSNRSRAWWTELTPVENFFLFEISPPTASRAPANIRAEAFCAGVQQVNSEWWSIPGSRHAETTEHALASDTPITQCLVKLFDDKGELDYADGESNINAEVLRWTVGDLAAGIVAISLGEKYDSRATPEERAARRAELRAKVH